MAQTDRVTNPRHRQSPTLNTKPDKPNKSRMIITALQRKRGASLDELCLLTGWQCHSMRGYLSGTLRKKQKLVIMSSVTKAGQRRYHLVDKTEPAQ